MAIRILTPAQQVTVLSDGVQDLLDGGVVLPGGGNALTTKLDAALSLLDNGNIQGAIGKLKDFINQVENYIKTGKLTSRQGQPLIDAAQALIIELGG